jgi:NAD(P)-dependent dehydrogenase (short-subunit alcohol dehydrogenase family)
MNTTQQTVAIVTGASSRIGLGVTMETNRRFTHRLGCSCYEDNRHIVTKVALEGDTYGTLVKERQVDGSYRNQMMTIERNGDATVIEFGSN